MIRTGAVYKDGPSPVLSFLSDGPRWLFGILCVFFLFGVFLTPKKKMRSIKKSALVKQNRRPFLRTFCCVFYSVKNKTKCSAPNQFLHHILLCFLLCKKQDKISSTAQFSKFSKMGCSQVVRRRNLGPSIKGSNPFIPVFCASSLRSLSKLKNFYYAKNRGHTAFTKLCCAGYFVLFFTE